jgi:amino acid permease
MVSVPWAFGVCGLPLGCTLSALSLTQVVISCYLYLKTRSICPDNPSSLYEMGFLLIGRFAIYWVAFTVWVCAFFLPIIYMAVFGEAFKLLVTNMTGHYSLPLDQLPFYETRVFYILLLAVLCIPMIFMKEISDVKFVGYTLFCAVIIFVILNIV